MEFYRSEARLKRVSSDRAQLFREFEAGLWTADQFKELVQDLTKSPPAKRRREYSPDWDDELPGKSQEI